MKIPINSVLSFELFIRNLLENFFQHPAHNLRAKLGLVDGNYEVGTGVGRNHSLLPPSICCTELPKGTGYLRVPS